MDGDGESETETLAGTESGCGAEIAPDFAQAETCEPFQCSFNGEVIEAVDDAGVG